MYKITKLYSISVTMDMNEGKKQNTSYVWRVS